MTPTITRPARGPLEVSLPAPLAEYPDPVKPSDVAALFGGRSVEALSRTRYRVPRARYRKVAWALFVTYGGLTVRQTGEPGDVCTFECFAADPGTRPDCICRCAGRHHGYGEDALDLEGAAARGVTLVEALAPNPEPEDYVTAFDDFADMRAFFGPPARFTFAEKKATKAAWREYYRALEWDEHVRRYQTTEVAK